MATRFVSVDRHTPLLLPPDLRDWVPADHLAHFVIAAELAEHEKKLAARQAQAAEGKKPRGPGPAAPTPEPKPTDQYNYTDPESRIMKDGTGFEQSDNAQAAVEVESRLIVGARVSQAPKVSTEWTLVCLAYNLKRLHRLGAGQKLALAG